MEETSINKKDAQDISPGRLFNFDEFEKVLRHSKIPARLIALRIKLNERRSAAADGC